ncbi:MDR family oxidoreductase [Shewanella fodinae]|uniref:acrylyl-CoA reductase (NADPH) n=1 Tax=Shewanella fodinae TaxID=552357 RepID=UPI001672E59D|nr:MDR family oxidoreductase [Shewanella fodinae]MCL2905939.1 oxidoreductase [Shewanella fodinae]GGY95274.1 alcohol dehydrogenase [Shewanella fodinae]
MFNALIINKDEQGYRCELQQLAEAQLPPENVLVQVDYSTLNYKDGLAITGKGPVVRKFPLVPGIDLAGTVIESAHPDYQVGDKVLLNGWGVGENYWGGLAQFARLNGDWLIPLPEAFSTRDVMAIGTAGYTAMLCIMALEKHGLTPEKGEVLVTGANGGVGTFAIALLAAKGYQVVAATGRPELADSLQALGASAIIDRSELSQPGKPLAKERWAAVVDSVGSHTLANACAATKADGAVAACGLAQGMDFPATVAPFILRGVSLLGINSVTRPKAERIAAWQQLAQWLPKAMLDHNTREIGLSEAIATASDLLAGKVQGRVLVDVNR